LVHDNDIDHNYNAYYVRVRSYSSFAVRIESDVVIAKQPPGCRYSRSERTTSLLTIDETHTRAHKYHLTCQPKMAWSRQCCESSPSIRQ